MQKNIADIIRNFGMANQMAEVALDRIEQKYSIELGRPKKSEVEGKKNYFDFDNDILKEATEMAQHYQIFYCLEVSIRKLVSQRLQETHGNDWWNAKRLDDNNKDVVAQAIRESAKKSQDNESIQCMTLRSSNLIDYTTFGELSEIIVSNWNIFGDMFTKKEAVQNVIKRLNTLRNPIAHFSLLAEDEVLRLKLAIKDWFRIMS